MKATKKTMVATLMIVMVLAVGIVPIFAQSDNAADLNSEKNTGRFRVYKEQLRERIQEYSSLEELDLSVLNEADAAPRIADAIEAEEIEDEDNAVGVLWILNARGSKVSLTPSTDAELAADRFGLQLVAEKVKNTEFGVLYEVHWGRIIQDETKTEIEGYALLDSDGVFYMTLEGEDLDFDAIGMIAAAPYGVRVEMKGYMTYEGEEFSHTMKGRAHPFGWYQRIANKHTQKMRPTPEDASDEVSVEPSSYTSVTGNASPA